MYKMSTAKKYSRPRLRQIMRDIKIKGITLMNKSEMLEKLNKLGFVPNEVFLAKSEEKATMKETNSNCSRNNPRKVIVNDLETALETENPSIYQAAREKLLPYPLGAAGELLRLTPCPYPLGPYCAYLLLLSLPVR